MNTIIPIILNLAIAILVYRIAYDPQEDYEPLKGTVKCLKQDDESTVLCAQCIARPL